MATLQGSDPNSLKGILASLGMIPSGSGGDGQVILGPEYIPVVVDGIIYGGVHKSEAARVVKSLRLLKLAQEKSDGRKLDMTTELAYLHPSVNVGGAYPGLYMFTQPGR